MYNDGKNLERVLNTAIKLNIKRKDWIMDNFCCGNNPGNLNNSSNFLDNIFENNNTEILLFLIIFLLLFTSYGNNNGFNRGF